MNPPDCNRHDRAQGAGEHAASPLLRANLGVLRESNPTLADLVARAELPQDCEFEANREPPVMRVNGTLVHSSRNPYREAERLVNASLSVPRTRVVLFFGFGLGFATEYALESERQYHCIVYEPDLGLIKAAFLTRDCRNILQNDRFSLFAGTDVEELIPLLRSVRDAELAVIRNRSLYIRNSASYQQLERVLEHLRQRQEVNHNTLVRFGKLWVRNLAKNLNVVSRAAGIQRLAEAYSGIPAVLLAGGPSLDAILPVLPQLSQRAVIIAVDTSLAAAIRAGVTPDYAVIVDPQYWNTRHLDAATGATCEIISESSTHPRVFRVLDGPVSMCSSLFPLGTHIEDPEEPFGALGAGGSVSTTAWDFARHLGCSPIYCAGLDLAFPGHNTHFRGSFFEARALTLCDRYFPVETMAFEYLHSGQSERIDANNGKTVLSDRRMSTYVWWFETQARRYPRTYTKNLSRDGAAIPGIPYASIDEPLAQAPRRRRIDEIRRSLSPSGRTEEQHKRRRTALRDRLSNLLEELASLGDLAEHAYRTSQTARSQYDRTGRVDPSLLQELNELDTKILNNEYRNVAAFLLQETTERVRQEHYHLDSLSMSEEIYGALSESCRYHHAVLSLDSLENA